MTIKQVLPYSSELVCLSGSGLEVLINPERGGDILSILHKESGQNVLWNSRKSKRQRPLPGPMNLSPDSFYDEYPGGIQELFPNTADSTLVLGAELPFHGEACRVSWNIEELDKEVRNALKLSTLLQRSPIQMMKTISVEKKGSSLTLRSKVKNLSLASLPYSWGFHPAFGEALSSGGCTVYLPCEEMFVHPESFSSQQKYEPRSKHSLKKVGSVGEYSARTEKDFGADLLYFRCTEGWMVARNHISGLTITLTWDIERMPFVWLWQEFYDPTGYPWWGLESIIGLEVHSSAPAQELKSLADKGEASILGPHQTLEAHLTLGITITDVSKRPVGVNAKGFPILEGDDYE